MIQSKERAWDNLNNYGAGFLFLTKPSQEAHSWSTQRLRWFRQEQKETSFPRRREPARMFKLFHARSKLSLPSILSNSRVESAHLHL